MDFDASWCPGCDKQILPKRIYVPVNPTPPPPPPPSSPQLSSPIRRSKTGTIRQRGGGLVQGTGRVKPNGTIKRSDTPPQPPRPAPPPIKHRTVVDPSPIPLYCCDECQLADIHNSRGTIPITYNPSPVDLSSESDSSSIDSQSSLSSASSNTQTSSTPLSPSIATLAAIYNFPPLPPPAPTFADDAASSDSENSYYPNEYNSGVMMAARRIAELCPKPAPRRSAYAPLPESRKPIPGWTDGSNAWRASVYSFSSPRANSDTSDPSSPKAYNSFVASSHRSRGVHSTLGSSSPSSSRSSSSKAAGSTSLPAESASDLLSRYSQSFNRRPESRPAFSSPASPSPSVDSFPSTSSTMKRERSLLKPGAEGKLLVPDVKMKMKVHGGSSASLGSVWEDGGSARRSSVRSPLSTSGSCDEDDHVTALFESRSARSETVKRPVVETRSWSYDNLKTYPIMRLPPKKEKRIEKRVVDGVEVEVEVEVVVHEPLKRLFLFPASTRP